MLSTIASFLNKCVQDVCKLSCNILIVKGFVNKFDGTILTSNLCEQNGKEFLTRCGDKIIKEPNTNSGRYLK